MTHFIAQDLDGYAIHGTGATEAEALAEAIENCGQGEDDNMEPLTDAQSAARFKTYPCTKALFDKVFAEGGAISWDIIDGVAMTEEEASNDE